MALRSRPRSATLTSGPGRGPASDGRTRRRRAAGHRRATEHRRAAGHSRADQHSRFGGHSGAGDHRGDRRRPPAPAEELRRRAELLFGERAVQWRESGNAPPETEELVSAAAAPPSPSSVLTVRATAAVRGTAPGLRPAAGPVSIPARVPAGSAGRASAPGGFRGPEPAGAPRLAEPEGPQERREPEEGREGPTAPDWRVRAGLVLRERMPVWLQARYAVERRGVVALVVVLVAAAVFAVQHFWAARPQSVSAPQVVRTQAHFPRKSEGAASGAAVGTTATPAAEIVVDVSGKVREPGIRRLPAGARVADALRAAGGIRPGVSTEGLNRARFLVDGEQVVVGTPAGAAAPPGPATGPLPGSTGTGPAAPVSLSTATVEQLDTLPGVGPVLAQHIVDYRARHGGFRSVDELREVNGIGDRRFTDLRDLVRP
ncbi:ComEA family DNA-binding protein [Streptomyces rameus]|uniref:ComEA family DNA-binding protein n=1 Tax=Streptomyces rameus TaxID=68261 RepID=UPI0031EFB45D